MLRQLAITAGLGVVLVASGSALAAVSKCDSGVTKAAGKKEKCLCGVYAKSQAKNEPPASDKLMKCMDKFSASCSKAKSVNDCIFQTSTCNAKETAVENEVAGTCNPGSPTMESKCDGGKTKAAGKKVSCKCSVYAKAYAKDLPPATDKLMKCTTKFSAACAKAEGRLDCSIQTRTCTQLETDADQDVTALCIAPPTSTTSSTTSSTTTSSTGVTTTSSTTSTTLCNCCGSLPSLLSFTTASSGCGTNPSGEVTPPRCTQGSNNGTSCRRCSCSVASDCGTGGVCTSGRCSAGDAGHTACVTNSTCAIGKTCTDSDGDCTGGGVCRGHLDCTGLYFGGGTPSGINLPGTVPDLGLSYSKIATCTGGNPNLTSSLAADVPAGCSTPAGTPTYGLRHCTSPGCIFGAPLALPNPATTATGTCVVNVIANRTGVGTGSVNCSTGAVGSPNLTLPLDSQIYLTGAIEPVRVCSTCVGGTPGVCGSGTCMGGPRDTLACTPETNALSGSYPTSHDCPPPNAPSGMIVSTCGLPSGSFIGCLPVDFALSTGTQSKTSFTSAAQARVFCGYCFDDSFTLAFENPPHPCASDANCTNGNFTSCQQHSNGAFRNSFATTISETGTPPNVCIADGADHSATLVSIFCVPPSYNGIVDPSGELPGPGAVSLPGVSKFIP